MGSLISAGMDCQCNSGGTGDGVITGGACGALGGALRAQTGTLPAARV